MAASFPENFMLERIRLSSQINVALVSKLKTQKSIYNVYKYSTNTFEICIPKKKLKLKIIQYNFKLNKNVLNNRYTYSMGVPSRKKLVEIFLMAKGVLRSTSRV